VRFWDPATGKIIREIAWDPRRGSNLALSPDGRMLALSEGEGKVRLRGTVTGRDGFVLEHPGCAVETSWFSRDGKRLVVMARLHEAGMGDPAYRPKWLLSLWEAESGRKVRQIPYHEIANWAPLAPDGSLLKALTSAEGKGVTLLRSVRPDEVLSWVDPALS